MPWNDIPDSTKATVLALVRAVELKDPETAAHCIRVGSGARQLAKAMGLDDYAQTVCEYAGLLHDIGKIGVPDEILHKPSKLTEAEFQLMKLHPEMSVRLIEPLAGSAFIRDVLPGVRHHHERYDGRGYPDGVMGEAIPLEARVVLIADTFDAMTATRAYRAGRPADAAYTELKLYAGRQFDERLVDIFLKSHQRARPREKRDFVTTGYTVARKRAA